MVSKQHLVVLSWSTVPMKGHYKISPQPSYSHFFFVFGSCFGINMGYSQIIAYICFCQGEIGRAMGRSQAGNWFRIPTWAQECNV